MEYKKFIENVSTDAINNIRCQPKSRILHDLWDDILDNGITEPLEIVYHADDFMMGLSDGHHRLDIAIDLKLSTVPAFVIISGEPAPRCAKFTKLCPKTLGRKYLKPSEIGL